MKNTIKELTKAEEEVMQYLWKLEKAFVKDLLALMPEPKPAYNTVSTIIRILEKKGFVGYTIFGNTHQYFPKISKDEYSAAFMKSFLKNYFGNSYQRLVSFFAKEDNISIAELEELRKIMDTEINKRKK